MSMRPLYLSFTPTNTSTTRFGTGLTAASGAALPITQTAVQDALAHKIIITPTGAVTGNYVLTGTDADGQTQTETLATDAANAVTSAKYYKTLTSVLAPSGLGAETVSIGFTSAFASKTIPLEIYLQGQTVNCQVNVTGTANFDIEDTMDDIRASYSPGPSQEDYVWLNDANFTNKSASLSAPLAVVARAIRFAVNSYTNGVVIELDVITPK